MRFFILLLLFFMLPAHANIVDTYQFSSPEKQQAALKLAKDLRCPQCQNQNLLESNSPIAKDLRLEVYTLIEQGHDEDYVINKMTSRYGDFVLYKPPLKTKTLLLWLLPGLSILAVLILVWYSSVQRQKPSFRESDDVKQDRKIDSTAAVSSVTDRDTPLFFKLGLAALFLLLPAVWYSFSERYPMLQAEQERIRSAALTEVSSEHKQNQRLIRIQKQLRENPQDAELWSALGQEYLYLNAFDASLQAYEQVRLLQGETAQVLSAKATVLYYQASQKITPVVQQLLDDAQKKDPNELTALLLLASDHFMNARYHQAIQYWQRALDSNDSRVNRATLIEAINTARLLERQ